MSAPSQRELLILKRSSSLLFPLLDYTFSIKSESARHRCAIREPLLVCLVSLNICYLARWLPYAIISSWKVKGAL